MKDAIRAAQEKAVEETERQLEAGAKSIELPSGERIRPESAWAATKAIRKAWEFDGGLYAGQERHQDGSWYAIVHLPLGKFEPAVKP